MSVPTTPTEATVAPAESCGCQSERKEMDPSDYGLLKMHAHNGAQRQADGASLYAENLRYDYLEGKNMTSSAESLGERRIDESGSGRARIIDYGPVPGAVK